MNFNGEAGVGRYDAKARSIIVYHDIDIRLLARGSRDADKFKTIARAEQTSAKVHSTVKPVPWSLSKMYRDVPALLTPYRRLTEPVTR